MARFGWALTSQRGSHRKLVHPARTDFLLVAFHRTLGRSSVRKVLRQAGIEESAFLREL
jgi:predicted RNA binding protein YcfA (HicA-like mRNA interferase family)